MLRARHFLGAAGLSVLIALVVGLISTAITATANGYLALGFQRSILFVFAGRFNAILLPALVVFGAWSIALVASSESRAQRMQNALPALLTSGAAAALVMRFAFLYNLQHFSRQWGRTVELFGLEVRQALLKWYVLATDLAFLIGALLVAFTAHRLADRGLRRLGLSGHLLWNRLGRPAVALPLLAVALLPALAVRAVRSGGTEVPNYIVISLDTLRADHLGCYGYGRDTSPHLDEMAAEGFQFEWAISQAPRTDLSHMSLFTSLYPSVHGVSSPHGLPPRRLTLAEQLRENGYRTAGFTDGGYLRRGLGFAQGFERYDDSGLVGFAETTEKFLKWQAGLPATAPFFAFLHTFDVHFPYDAPSPWRERYVDPAYDGRFTPDIWAWKRFGGELSRAPAQAPAVTAQDLAYVRARYDGGLSWVDSLVGDLVAELRRRGLLESTWLIVISDHGEEFFEHGEIFHSVLYHTVTRVPLILRPPGGADVPRRIPEIVELLDLTPTLLQLSGLKPPGEIDGRSLLPLIDGTSVRWPSLAFSEAPFLDFWHRALTTADLHLVVSSETDDPKVFDFRADPLEQSALPAGERHEEVEEMVRLLERWSLKVGGPGSSDRRPKALDPETERQLRALGYVD